MREVFANFSTDVSPIIAERLFERRIAVIKKGKETERTDERGRTIIKTSVKLEIA
jgi:hypothetical protein